LREQATVQRFRSECRSLFTPREAIDPSTPQTVDLPDAEVRFWSGFLPTAEADVAFVELQQATAWVQENIKLYGKLIPVPRLTAWYGDAGKTYRYSGITVTPMPWSPLLLQLKTQVEEASATQFNSVLLNLYRNERDSVSWHADDEPELGRNPVIASLSLGVVRRFQLKHRHDRKEIYEVRLADGSLLVMSGSTQHYWLHQVPKEKCSCGPRINLTFRTIV
jgi:alkylated DNA repair dioxygenase AlkB